MTDFLSALRLYLLADQATYALCGAAIYVLAMPQFEQELVDMNTGLPIGPHKVVVILASGGAMGKMRHTITEARVDIVNFGETDWDAAAMERATAEACKSLCRATYGGVLLHGATVAAGPVQGRDPITFWPIMRRQIVLRADEREVGT